MAIQFYIADLETNGLLVGHHEICELSIIRADDRMQLTRKVRVDNIKNSSLDALNIIKRSSEDLKKGISKKDLIEQVEGFIKEDGLTPAHRCLVGHNIINFDKKFLWHLWDAHNKTFPFDLYLDTLHMSKAHAKKLGMIKPSLRLVNACELFGIPKVAGEHEASADTRNCYLLWNQLCKSIDYLDHIRRIPHNGEG